MIMITVFTSYDSGYQPINDSMFPLMGAKRSSTIINQPAATAIFALDTLLDDDTSS